MKKISFFAAVVVMGLVLLVTLTGREDFTPLPDNAKASLVVIKKSTREMTLYAGNDVLRSYRVSLGRGGLAPKEREGDKLTPEGKYKITGRMENSAYHRSLRISYPDEKDKKRAAAKGVPPGGDIMIHGIRNGLGWLGTHHRKLDWTQGCVAVTNDEIGEIWRVVADGTPVRIEP